MFHVKHQVTHSGSTKIKTIVKNTNNKRREQNERIKKKNYFFLSFSSIALNAASLSSVEVSSSPATLLLIN